MDLPDYRRRGDNSPPPSAPVGGELSGDDYDHNLDETERALGELDDETLKVGDATPVPPGTGAIELTDTMVIIRAGVPAERTMAALQDALIGDFLDYMDGML